MVKKLHCRNCNGLRNYKILHEVTRHGVEEDGYFHWSSQYAIIECSGCNNISFLHIYSDSEMIIFNDQGIPEYEDKISIYPPYLEFGNEIEYTHFLPERIKQIYNETISAFKANSYILTAGGLRAVIEAVCIHLNIKKDNLAERIDQLHKGGYLTLNESRRLHSIRFMGNDALHEIEIPQKEHLYILLDIINHLLENLFISDKRLKGTLDVIIDSYEDFFKLIIKRVAHNNIGQELTLKQLLGKSIRLITKNRIAILENELFLNIKNGKIEFLSVVNNKPEYLYKITEIPLYYDF